MLMMRARARERERERERQRETETDRDRQREREKRPKMRPSEKSDLKCAHQRFESAHSSKIRSKAKAAMQLYIYTAAVRVVHRG